MKIVISADGGVRLDEPENLRGFSVVSDEPIDRIVSALEAAGAGTGSDTDGHVWVASDAVRALATGTVDDGWNNDFDGVLSYAATKGWISEDGRSILAHVEEQTA